MTALSVATYQTGFVVAQLFFSAWLFPLGWLVLRSGFLPRLLGWLLLLDGVGVLVWFLQVLLAPDHPAISYPGMGGGVRRRARTRDLARRQGCQGAAALTGTAVCEGTCVSAPVYVVTDIEVDGPWPGPNSMRSFASVAVTAQGEQLGEFEAVLEPLPGSQPDPDTHTWFQTIPEAWAAATRNPRPVPDVMEDFAAWVLGLGDVRHFVASPLGFDDARGYAHLLVRLLQSRSEA